MEVVYEGWLVKSPPEKRIRRAKWRRRWFVLRPSGQVPQQYILEYYTDQTYRKLKGAIDLDQCEQVDAGLEVDTKSKFVFDIKTTKRTYYLVAETEDIMNKWVDCICKVCGLRQQPEEAVTALEVADPPVPEPNVSSEMPDQPRPASKVVTETPQPPEPHPLLEPLLDRSSPKDDSNPYIPISECITGKPVSNGAPPTPNSRASATRGSRLADFYDVPRCGTGRTSPDPIMDVMCRVPRPPDRPTRDATGGSVRLDAVPPPTVNWSTYPKDSSAPGANGQAQDYDPVPPLRPTSSGSHTDPTAVAPSVYNGDTLGRAGLTIRKAGLAGIAPPRPPKAWNGTEEGYDRVPPARPTSVDADVTETDGIPPRPPKPANIRVRPSTGGYDAYDVPPSLQRSSQDAYDVPPPPQVRPASHDGYSVPPCPQPVLRNDGYDVPNPASAARTSYDAYDVPRPSAEVPSPSARVAPALPHPPRNSLDETYDFPKSAASPDVLVPLSATGQRPRMHQYCNAPVGMFSSRDNIFNYEYRPSLMDAVQRDDVDALMQQPSSAPYANISTSPSTPNLTAVPPAINRGLKPRKASSDNSTSLPVFPLAPPPVTRNCNQTHTSFTRPRHRSKGDLLAPEEDSWSNASSSRRNSTNEDPVTRQTGGVPKKKGEIQYLDLDLDSEPGGPAQSPRSPEQKATGSNTVYRTVDFLKTKAFNRTRQNVEESYRSHKDGEPCK
ncbi:hypothetical protein HPB47_028484 [Ixodes persulcatus]|uniref:Uncharacterized protein n=1 Tax=Ixodes persulcatus TaxID=34615 RepID=A0AC60PT29_IXOPE|nr:hypothetical protein HPB47_028484 [Ixodes persulcatus]